MKAYLPVHTVREMTGEMDGSGGDKKWSKRKTFNAGVHQLCGVWITDVSMAMEQPAKPLREASFQFVGLQVMELKGLLEGFKRCIHNVFLMDLWHVCVCVCVCTCDTFVCGFF